MNRILLLVGLIGCGVAAMSAYEVWEESKIKAEDRPREVTAELLLRDGPRDNAYVRVSDFVWGKHLRFRAEGDRVDHVLIELQPTLQENGKRLIVRTKTILSEDQIAQLKGSKKLEGIVVSAIGGLRLSEYDAAKEYFSNLERAVLVVDLDRRPIQTSFFRFFPWIYGTVGVGALAILLVRKVRARAHKQPSKGGPIRAE